MSAVTLFAGLAPRLIENQSGNVTQCQADVGFFANVDAEAAGELN
jgi:hypothetical protein